MNDSVNHPAHYTQGGIECIDAIKAAVTGLEGFEAVLTAQVVKYIWRWKHKNGLEDLKKALWYLKRLIKTVGGDEDLIDSVAQPTKKGHWVIKHVDHPTIGLDATYAVCSECGECCSSYGFDELRDQFCRWCGADMRDENGNVDLRGESDALDTMQ